MASGKWEHRRGESALASIKSLLKPVTAVVSKINTLWGTWLSLIYGINSIYSLVNSITLPDISDEVLIWVRSISEMAETIILKLIFGSLVLVELIGMLVELVILALINGILGIITQIILLLPML